MDFDFVIIADAPVSRCFQNAGIHRFVEACDFIRALPYRRNKDKGNLLSVFSEQCGTCSTKHAVLKTLATENHRQDVELILGIFKMSVYNTPGIRATLQAHGLDYIPEAHNYLRVSGRRVDCTRKGFDIELIREDILEEIVITPDQIGAFKVRCHRKALQDWLKREELPFSPDQLWQIREQCIADLSGNDAR